MGSVTIAPFDLTSKVNIFVLISTNTSNDSEWIDFAVKHFSHLYNDVTYSEIESIFLLAYINTWGFHVPGPDPESKGVITGTGLYYVGSMFNHSCNPNSAFLSTCLNNQKVLIAMKDIRQGEEVTCAYINCQQNRDARQNELKFGWNFDCTCQRSVVNVRDNEFKRFQM